MTIALALSIPVAIAQRDEIIATLFGVVLFTLLVEGLTMKWLLQRLNLLGDQPLRQHFLEILARQVALGRVLERLQTLQQRPGISLEFYRYQIDLVEAQLRNLQSESQKLLHEEPELQAFAVEKLSQEIQAIESDTYAEFVRLGLLKQELSPLLAEVLREAN
ncbi:hypothetical protein [Neosynechococcus sphagnicola]|uniref:hypothetical protein n=1 Tax=Neosynechococcus sphagnicola TaxID=1501145 RepID=UPI003084018F